MKSKIRTAIRLWQSDRRLVIAAVFNYIIKAGILNVIPDRVFLCIAYRVYIGRKLNLKEPIGFNEKLQWLKLNYRRPEFVQYVDKYAVKDYVASRIGEEFIIKTLGVYDSFEEIDFSTMPNQFVLKCTHDSGSVVIVEQKDSMNRKEACRKLTKALRRDMYHWGREWVYKDVPHRIIVEEYISDTKSGNGLTDYKFMCFNGKVKCIFTVTNRFSKEGMHVTFYDLNWNIMPFERHYPADSIPIDKPTSFKRMVELAEKLSEDIPFVRVDFYEVDSKPLFGEMTFFPGCGFEEFSPEEWDIILGSWIKLPESNE